MTYLLNEVNAGSQVHTKVNELPLNSFFLVLLLFQHKHVVVEELLQFLICEVDTQLLQAVELLQYIDVIDICKTCEIFDFEHEYWQIFTSKISNPAMSSTPMKNCLCCFVSNISLIRMTIHKNIFS